MDADELRELARERAVRDLPPPGLLARLTTFFPLWEEQPLVHELIQRSARVLAGTTAGGEKPVYLLGYIPLDELDAERVTEFTDPERELPDLLRPLRLRSCSIRGKLDASASWHTDTAWSMNVNLRGAEYGERWPTAEFRCAIHEQVFRSRLPRTFRHALVEHTLAVASGIQAATGFITLDYSFEAYERWYGLNLLEVSLQSRHLLLGYYWGNILSAGHVERLGGWDRIRDEAPVFRAELVDPERMLVYLQVTEDVEQLRDDNLRELKNYLKPLLHPPVPEYRYPGPERYRFVS
jgi:hypothetical protein